MTACVLLCSFNCFMKTHLIFTVLLLTQKLIASEQQYTITGTIKDNIGVVPNAHIINLDSREGTYTDAFGNFSITAKKGDTLKFSSIQHYSKIIAVSKEILEKEINTIFLARKTYTLEEVELKQHSLSGNLLIDIKQTPKDTITELVGNLVSEINNMDNYAILNMPIGKDEIHLQKGIAPSIPNSFGGAGASIPLGSKMDERLKQRKEELQIAKLFPDKLRNGLGENFFFITLKIPQDRYYNFLDYCTFVGIEELFYKNKHLELIQLLKKESILYLKGLKTDK